MVDLQEVDCCVVDIKFEENGHVLPPALPRDSARYSHTIIRGRRENEDDKEDVSGLVPMLVHETGDQ